MYKVSIFLICSFLVLPTVWSQSYKTDFSPITSSGKIPKDLIKKSSEKYEMRKEGFKGDKRSTRKSKEEFILQSTFTIDELLLSGDVFFNDTISKYVNCVADELLKYNKKLRSKLNFYLIRSNYVNAFATERGAIFITVGLMAKLNNEAELAFILAHEIAHFEKNHLMNEYLESENIKKNKSAYRNKTPEDILLAKSNYSKELELEADEFGFKYFTNSDYSLEAAFSVMDVLKYSSYPFEDKEIDFEFLQNGNFTFPNNYFTDTLVPIKINEDYDDSESTHPNTKKRKEKIADYLRKEEEQNKENLFIVSENSFNFCRELSRFELINNYITERDYAMGFYSNYLLQEKYPNNKFLKQNMGYSLYAMARYKSRNHESKVIRREKEWQGKFFKSLQLLNNITDKELSAIAVSYNYQVYKEFPNDTFLKEVVLDAIRTLVYDENMRLDYYKNKRQKEKILANYQMELLKKPFEGIDTAHLSHLEIKRIKRKQERERAELEKSIHFDQFIFTHLLDDEEFVRLFKTIEIEHNSIDRSDLNQKKASRLQRKEMKKTSKRGFSLGIDRIVFSEPYYHKLDERKSIQTKYIQSEKNQSSLREEMLMLADKIELNIEILGQQKLIDSEIEKLNDVSLLNRWVAEKSAHGQLDIIPYSSKYTNRLVEKYGTKHFGWIGVISTKYKRSFNFKLFALSTFSIYGIPVFIASLFTPDNYTLYYSLVVDVKNNKFLLQDYEYSDSKDNNDLIKGQLYQTFLQIKRKKRD